MAGFRKATGQLLGLLLGVVPLAGCQDGDAGEGSGEVTWHQHMAPLMAEKCSGCHTAGGIGPMALDSFVDAKKWAAQSAAAVAKDQMPPWGAHDTDECSPPLPWKDDLRLSAAEKAMFQRWVQQGTPEGDPERARPLPPAPELGLPNPTRELVLPGQTELSGTSDRFLCFVLDPELTEEVWLDGVQVTAGNAEVVHHVLVYADPTAASVELLTDGDSYDCFGGPGIPSPRLVGAWAPGALPSVTPDKVALPLEAGSRLVVQVHYHPTGKGVDIDEGTRVALRWSSERPEYVGSISLIGNFGVQNSLLAGGDGYGLMPGPNDPEEGPAFVIPPNVSDHVETQRFLVPGEGAPGLRFHVWAAGSHMHYVGRDMRSVVRRKNGEELCLVQTPNWDFQWQRSYVYDGPIEQVPTLIPGDVLEMRCTYDNTLDNPFLRSALEEQGLEEPVEVRLGEETLDEMCLGVFGVAVPWLYGDALR